MLRAKVSNMDVRTASGSDRGCSKLAAKGSMEKGLEQVFGLAGSFALLAADPLELLDNLGEFFL